MTTKVPVELLVADFLKKKGYSRTLDIFQNEVGVLFDYDYEAVSFEPLEEIVQDRHNFLEHHYDGGLSAAGKSNNKGNNNNNISGSSNNISPSHELLHLVKPWQFTNIESKKPLELPDQLSNALCLNLSIGSIKTGHLDKHSSTAVTKPTNITKPTLLISANDRILKVVDLHHLGKVLAVSHPKDSKMIYKSFIAIDGTNILVAGGMDGFAYVFQFPEEKKSKEIEETNNDEDRNCTAAAVPYLKLLQKVKLHNRVITSIQYLPNCVDNNKHDGYLVSIGFDTTLSIAQISLSSDLNSNHNNSLTPSSQQKQQVLVSQLSTFKLLSNATDIKVFSYKFTNNDETAITTVPLILLSRLNSTLLSLFTLYNGDNNGDDNSNKGRQLAEVARISLNDAEFSNHEFSPMNIAVFNPNDSRNYVIDQTEINNDVAKLPLIAVATSHVPYMRIVTVTLPLNLQEIITTSPAKLSNTANTALNSNPSFRQPQLQQQLVGIPTIRGQIIANINSLSPQDKFSNPLIHWKLNGTGIWIAGDDGIIRGVNFAQDRLSVVKILKGYDGDKKGNVGIRFKAFVGYVGGGGDEEKEGLVVASSDKQIHIWE